MKVQIKMEKLSLKWKDFHTTVSRSFEKFRTEEYLHDVTLMSEDYFEISAHKLVLSACSEHFRNIFKKCKGTNPLICLDGVTRVELQDIMDYIYLGEAKIEKERLYRFLQVAKKLKLEGLTNFEGAYKDEGVNNQENEKYSHSKSIIEEPTDKYTNVTATLDFEKTRIDTGRSDGIDMNLKQSKSAPPVRKVLRGFHPGINVKLSELDKKIAKYGKKTADGQWKCNICRKGVDGIQKRNLGDHIDACLNGKVFFDCPSCDSTFRHRSGLSKHKMIAH